MVRKKIIVCIICIIAFSSYVNAKAETSIDGDKITSIVVPKKYSEQQMLKEQLKKKKIHVNRRKGIT